MKQRYFNFFSIPQILCLISFWGALVYFVYALNLIGLIISLTLTLVSYFIIQSFYRPNNQKDNQEKIRWTPLSLFLIILYLLVIAFNFYLLFSRNTSDSIISPWQAVPPYFFILYGLATIFLFIIIITRQTVPLFLIIIHYFLTFSIALLIYQIGYGFDPFIHRATMALIDKIGAVMPKTYYYLGQYSLIVIIHKISRISLTTLDKVLVPLLSSIFLPLSLWRFLKSWTNDTKIISLIILIVLIFTFPFLIVTTPQNFAYLLLLLVILFGLVCANVYDLTIIYLLALTALVTQPIAGLPALLFALVLTVYHSDRTKLKKYFYFIILFITIISLPLTFYLLDKNGSGADTTVSPIDNNSALPVVPIIPGRHNFILNFIYLYGFNLKYLIIFLIIVGLFLAYHQRKKSRLLVIYLLMSAALLVSYLISVKLPFNFLINYERSNYSDRILLEAAFFCLPFLLLSLYWLSKRILQQNDLIKYSLLSFLGCLIIAALYLSYPRFDNYFNSHGQSTSLSDIKTVTLIKQTAKADYIVLANQQVSAAALNQFGFAKYYKPALSTADKNLSEIFYYPIPTGGPLYQFYLAMVYKKPSRQTMLAAMDLVGVSQGYFVLNKYWWAFDKILAEAKLEANSWQSIDDGSVYVFKYSK